MKRYLLLAAICLVLPCAASAQCDCITDEVKFDFRKDKKPQQDLMMKVLGERKDEASIVAVKSIFETPASKGEKGRKALKTVVRTYCAALVPDNAPFIDGLAAHVDSVYQKTELTYFSALLSTSACKAVKKRLENLNQITAPVDPASKQGKEKDSQGLIDLITRLNKELANVRGSVNVLQLGFILVMIILASLLFFVIRQFRVLNKKQEPLPLNPTLAEPEKELKPNVTQQNIAIQTLNHKLEKQQGELDYLNELLRKDSTPISSAQPAAPDASTPEKKIYAAAPNGKTFTRVSDTLIPQESYFVIEARSDSDEGTLNLVDDDYNRSHAFSLVDILRGPCELRGTGRPPSPSSVTITPGTVKKENGFWTITNPIVLQW